MAHAHDHKDHSHSHGHGSHGHGHHVHTSLGNVKRLSIALVLVALYTVAEAVGGLVTGSLALLADAGHMLSDVAALGIALGAIYLSRRPATPARTYGYRRAEVLGAMTNSVALIVIAIFIFFEAWERFDDPPEVLGGTMLLVALGGLVVNLIGVFLLHQGQGESLNVRGAWLHMIADTLGSLGAMISAFLIWQFDWRLADPIASVVIGCLILWSSLALLRETVDVLMEAVPSRLDLPAISERLEDVTGVLSVHDLHVWTISSGHDALTAHVVTETPSSEVLPRLRNLLDDEFGLHHVTLQIEDEDGMCEDCIFERGIDDN
jgi:cobalt-zinc-cadmium efflux system protein